MAVLITGASGFLGRHLVRHLLSTEDEELVVFDQRPLPDPEHDERTTFVAGDVRDLAHLIATIERLEVTAVVHLAYALEAGSGGTRGQVETNVMGTTNVFEAARACCIDRVVYASSAYVYPHRRELSGPCYSESDPPAPDGVYGACKVLGEQVAAAYREVDGLDSVGLRFTKVFGPGRGERELVATDEMVLPELALWGQPVIMPPDAQLFDWMYVDDAVEVVRLALRAPHIEHPVLNVASECREAGDVTTVLRCLLPRARIHSADLPFVTTSLLRTDLLYSELGFVPRYTLEEAVADYLERASYQPAPQRVP